MDLMSILKDSPIAIAMIVVIILFLKFLRDERVSQSKRDEAFEARAQVRNKLFADTVKELSDQAAQRARECHEVHNQSIRTIERNTEALDEMQQAVHRLVADTKANARRAAASETGK